ncbi:hypothetical protein J1614_011116 [Plenodomus biglobosus]|nr:hypothetical protein J1614_011116 [Plenodomus biglobosus]
MAAPPPNPPSSTTLPTRPPIDPSLAHVLSAYPIPDDLDLDLMRGMNLVPEGEPNPFDYNATTVLAAHPNYTHEEYTTSGVDGNEIVISVFTPSGGPSAGVGGEGGGEQGDMEKEKEHQEEQERQPGETKKYPPPKPALYHIHGGGLVSGTRFSGVAETLSLLPPGCILISPTYRLAPETRAPGAAEDCYAGLQWTFAHAERLGIDASRVVVYGVSGGGALAASMCLMVRDRGEEEGCGIEVEAGTKAEGEKGEDKAKSKAKPKPKALLLHTPMLDDRAIHPSDTQFHRSSPWSGVSNTQAWDLALGPGLRGSPTVTPYQAPARETRYHGLPPMYVDVAECEVFRDAAVRWAGEVWRAGGNCELHVWPGVWHIFDMWGEEGRPLVVASSVAAKRNWLERMMGEGGVVGAG